MSSGNTATSDAALARRAYRPVLRGYFAVAAIYYFVMSFVHLWELDGADLAMMLSASASAFVALGFAFHKLKKMKPTVRFEYLTIIANIMVFLNIMVALHIDFASAKLAYFVMATLIFAGTSVSMIQGVFSVSMAVAGLAFFLVSGSAKDMNVYAFVAVAAAICALTISHYWRRAVIFASRSISDATSKLRDAQMISESMRLRSLTDSLTGLPNRRAFFEALQDAMGYPELQKRQWLLLLDLDGFKYVNDAYGHLAGDALLVNVAQRLSDYCNGTAHVSRMGGDEFNVIRFGDVSRRELEAWALALLEVISEPYDIDGRHVQISASIGCHQMKAPMSEQDLVRNADYALLKAKAAGKNRAIVFSKEHAKDAEERFRIEQALRAADFDSEIQILLQPQYDLASNLPVRAEVLARWNSPVFGMIEPNQFIKVAEDGGLITQITLTVLRKSIEAIKAGKFHIPVSVNLSSHDLISNQIVNKVIEMVRSSGVRPELIEFEITETAMMADIEKATTNLIRLSENGHPIALDDFGTGYSNFNYLRSLPINKLKVDRSFIEDIGNPMTEKILRSLTGMARSLGVHCLLEGVENELELVIAKRVGAQSVQGYYFGKPMTSEELESLLDDGEGDAKIRAKQKAFG